MEGGRLLWVSNFSHHLCRHERGRFVGVYLGLQGKKVFIDPMCVLRLKLQSFMKQELITMFMKQVELGVVAGIPREGKREALETRATGSVALV